MFNIEEELKKLPKEPGVYIMHDAHDDIIYVGKAISLKNRVRQYFQSSRNLTPKIQQYMVSKIARFEYIVTDSELEALVLECNLLRNTGRNIIQCSRMIRHIHILKSQSMNLIRGFCFQGQ